MPLPLLCRQRADIVASALSRFADPDYKAKANFPCEILRFKLLRSVPQFQTLVDVYMNTELSFAVKKI